MMCDPTLDSAHGVGLHATPPAISLPLGAAIGILAGIFIGSAAWTLVPLAFWAVKVLALR
jgi:hypothetical protein